MIRQEYRTMAFLMGISLALLLAGCNDHASRKQINRRTENMARTARQFQEEEEQRPESLAWTLQTLREQHQKDVQNSAENPRRLGRMIQDDFDRWAERQPAYQKEIKNQLKGDPDNIRRTAPQMAW